MGLRLFEQVLSRNMISAATSIKGSTRWFSEPSNMITKCLPWPGFFFSWSSFCRNFIVSIHSCVGTLDVWVDILRRAGERTGIDPYLRLLPIIVDSHRVKHTAACLLAYCGKRVDVSQESSEKLTNQYSWYLDGIFLPSCVSAAKFQSFKFNA